MKYNKCKIIGLTGGIASGKSTVSHIIKEKGYKLIDADKIARQVVELNKPAYKEIINYFGVDILKEDKSIDRKTLGYMVFSDEELLQKLNQITHPYIYEEIRNQIEDICKREDVIFLDIPLLFEEIDKIRRHDISFDEIWLVYVDEKNQLERLMKRNTLSLEEAKQRIDLQIALEEKKKMATRVIDNRNSIEFLKSQVEKELYKLNLR